MLIGGCGATRPLNLELFRRGKKNYGFCDRPQQRRNADKINLPSTCITVLPGIFAFGVSRSRVSQALDPVWRPSTNPSRKKMTRRTHRAVLPPSGVNESSAARRGGGRAGAGGRRAGGRGAGG